MCTYICRQMFKAGSRPHEFSTPLSLPLPRSNKAVCSRSPLQPVERDQPVDFKGVATRSPQDTAVSRSTVSGLRHLTSLPSPSLSLRQPSLHTMISAKLKWIMAPFSLVVPQGCKAPCRVTVTMVLLLYLGQFN